ncbi:LysR family transcriptional regulator [Tsuneonella deserti]|uniref:LysR family transcriptional regulator n=1 Tax=Tsuneonella deserti TaxID=2035528 RepID=UPI001E55A6F0|nr:LysR family transcriptional regulator [Tsuneonella deserti]
MESFRWGFAILDSRLKHAVAVGQYRSFSRAAEACSLSQSAVSKSVADLERQLGYALFHRTSRSVMPTEEGRDFIERAARLLADMAELLGDRDRSANPYAGPLRVGLFPGSMDWILTEPLIRLLRRHSAVRFEIVSGNSERGVRLLSRGDIDIAFGLEPAFASWPQFKCERVATIEILPFVRSGHPLLLRRAAAKDALVEYEFVVPSSSEPYSSIIQEMYEQAGQHPVQKIHMTDQFVHVRRIVASSDAIGMIARQFTKSSWFRAGFDTLEETDFLEPLTLCYAARNRWPLKPAARALVSYVRDTWRERVSNSRHVV